MLCYFIFFYLFVFNVWIWESNKKWKKAGNKRGNVWTNLMTIEKYPFYDGQADTQEVHQYMPLCLMLDFKKKKSKMTLPHFWDDYSIFLSTQNSHHVTPSFSFHLFPIHTPHTHMTTIMSPPNTTHLHILFFGFT